MSTIRGCRWNHRDLQCGPLIFWFIPPLPSRPLSHGDLQPGQPTSSSIHLCFTFTSLSIPRFLDLSWPLTVKRRTPDAHIIFFMCVCVMCPLTSLSRLLSKELGAYWISSFLSIDHKIKVCDGEFSNPAHPRDCYGCSWPTYFKKHNACFSFSIIIWNETYELRANQLTASVSSHLYLCHSSPAIEEWQKKDWTSIWFHVGGLIKQSQ